MKLSFVVMGSSCCSADCWFEQNKPDDVINYTFKKGGLLYKRPACLLCLMKVGSD